MQRSPWIHQLERTRPVSVLESDAGADIAIVGGGIAGIATAFWTLRETTSSVILLEAGKVAHGATGHNAGQAVSYFERPFASVVEEFGTALAVAGVLETKHAWNLIDEMQAEAALSTKVSSFTGYAGFVSIAQVHSLLQDLKLQADAGIRTEYVFIADDAMTEIPAQFAEICELLPRARLQDMLEVKDARYVAALATRKGVVNSARFTEGLANYLLAAYPERFSLVEHTPVERVVLCGAEARLETKHHIVQAHRVVLCTNGFLGMQIVNEDKADIDSAFHETVSGTVGAMVGFVGNESRPPVAIAYVESDRHEDPYYYLTRRAYGDATLVCVGGPEAKIPSRTQYSAHIDYVPKAREQIKSFVEREVRGEDGLHAAFAWHGLMGYTKSGLRLVGAEPLNPVLMYNLGCNGVGILLSIAGGRRIARILAGETLEPSIFDPQDRREGERPNRLPYKASWFPSS